MKRQIIAILTLLFSYTSHGQGSKARFGIRGGAGISKPGVSYVTTVSPGKEKEKVGIVLGAFVNIAANKNMVIQPGIQYMKKGWREDYGYSYYDERSINYFEIPLNLLFKLNEKERHFYVGTGLSPAFRAGRFYGSGVKRFDLGINALAGYALPIGFSVNLGYTHGLLNVTADKNYIANIRNRFLSLTAGYEF